MKENREKEKTGKKEENQSGIVTRESVSAVCALFSALAFFILCTRSLIFGNIGIAVNSFLLGLFGYLAYPLLLSVCYLSVTSFFGKRFVRNRKVGAALAVSVLCAMLIIHTAVTYTWSLSGYLSRCFFAPGEGNHGIDTSTPAGWTGGLVVYALARLTTKAGAIVILSVLFLLFAYLTVRFWAGKALRAEKEKKSRAPKNTAAPAPAPANGYADPRAASANGVYVEPSAGGEYANARPAQAPASPFPPVAPSGQAYAQPGPHAPGREGNGYAVRPEVRQRPGVSLPDEAPRSAPYNNTARPEPQPQARTPQARPVSNAFSPFGTVHADGREKRGGDPAVPAGDSRAFLFGSTPAEIYNKNLIFDDNANVNKRPPADPNQPTVYGSSFAGSYASAYADSVNGEESSRPAKILTDNAPGLSSSDSFGGGAEEKAFSRPPVTPVQPARPFEPEPPARSFAPDPAPQPMRPAQPFVYGEPAGTGTDAERDPAETPAARPAMPSDSEPSQGASGSTRPAFMDLFSPSNPNLFGGGENSGAGTRDREPDGGLFGGRQSSGAETRDREPDAGLFGGRQSSDAGTRDREPEKNDRFSDRNADDDFEERVGGRPEGGMSEEDPETPPEESRRDVFDEDPYSLRSDFSERPAPADRREEGGRREIPEDRVDRREMSDRSAPAPVPVPPKPKKPRAHRPYQHVPLDYFDCSDVEPDASSMEVEFTKQTILDTLEAFKVTDSTISSVTYGPTVTRYNVVIPRNIAARKVVALDQEIAMSLCAGSGVNIYPNFDDGAVSIEVPNKKRQFVQLGCMLTGDAFVKSKPSALMFAMGKDVANRKVYGDICKMTHLLVAGASGSGKSVFLRSLIISLIYKYSPQELRLILIDPKKTEFVIYDHLPHLMVDEIVTETNKVIQTLNWAIGEMNRRYGLFEQMSRSGTYVVNIDEYNAAIGAGEEKLAKIVIIVDELADLMLSAKKEVEDRIQNLTQKSRAAGIHLILATQRPSADVITGVIKGNLPTRIAFAVASDVDSRVILDTSGAQKLLGMGDLLYLAAGMNTPVRVQGASISSEDAQKVVNYIKANNEADFDEAVSDFINNKSSSGGDSSAEEVEDVYIEALRYVILSGSASISMIQRKCSVGYNKAGRIIEWMEDMGYISAFDGAKARKVLITKEEFESNYGPM